MGEDKVSSFARLVAGEAGFESCLGEVRFAILIELSETPATRLQPILLNPWPSTEC
jgi:hypothetical protein